MAAILLLEPNSKLQDIYSRALQKHTYTVHGATSAQDALRVLDTHAVSAIILELQLVAHNGIEFLYELRSYPEWQKMPVIIHSLVPKAEFSDASTLWHELGINAYLYKPSTSLHTLLQHVHRAIPASVT